MGRIFLENVRCFHKKHSFPFPKILLLVGENSTGKSTLMASIRYAWDICNKIAVPNFNEEPFLLGTYDQIATHRGGNIGRSKYFKIGFENKPYNKSKNTARVCAEFRAIDSQPELITWQYKYGKFGFRIDYPQNDEITIFSPKGEQIIKDFPMAIAEQYSLPNMINFLSFYFTQFRKGKRKNIISNRDLKTIEDTYRILNKEFGTRPYAIAPIRTRPQRTYDPLKDTPNPEGAHVPMTLARYLPSHKKIWMDYYNAIKKFGQASGLFSDLQVKRMGRKSSDPFQLRIKIKGPSFNLSDVGYGVSQVLPILVDSISKPNNTTFLLQQPEVHLHPKAQAELASLLYTLAKHDSKRFIIETHSDYFVDRIRMDIRDGNVINQNDIRILYFSRNGSQVDCIELELDKNGNYKEVPENYRQFFLDEQLNLLSGE